MAKHPHKLMLIENRTWRCVLEGCSFFVHLGLAHVITGKRIICWKCDDTFLVEGELSTREPRPTCIMCKGGFVAPTPMELDAYIKERIRQKELENKRNKTEIVTEEDQIEVIEADEVQHAYGCAFNEGGECDCK